ncbi:Scr1 family TA system antitoxin-like transcriptional regulator [Streptomyces sp. NPDC020875]|uniref:Scr1 family TA system antitoxin-like transcriptional regulator n=1 Tax=Streptomyces sp. NPDC020875 TaxID=3154898 RepID=UPI0034010F01
MNAPAPIVRPGPAVGGAYLRTARQDQRLLARQIARETGLSLETVRRIETGRALRDDHPGVDRLIDSYWPHWPVHALELSEIIRTRCCVTDRGEGARDRLAAVAAQSTSLSLASLDTIPAPLRAPRYRAALGDTTPPFPGTTGLRAADRDTRLEIFLGEAALHQLGDRDTAAEQLGLLLDVARHHTVRIIGWNPHPDVGHVPLRSGYAYGHSRIGPVPVPFVDADGTGTSYPGPDEAFGVGYRLELCRQTALSRDTSLTLLRAAYRDRTDRTPAALPA